MTTQTLSRLLKIFVASVRVLRANSSPLLRPEIYELYQRRLRSAVIDGYLAGVPAEYREELIAVARREFDYLKTRSGGRNWQIGKTIIAATVLSVIVARWAAEIQTITELPKENPD